MTKLTSRQIRRNRERRADLINTIIVSACMATVAVPLIGIVAVWAFAFGSTL